MKLPRQDRTVRSGLYVWQLPPEKCAEVARETIQITEMQQVPVMVKTQLHASGGASLRPRPQACSFCAEVSKLWLYHSIITHHGIFHSEGHLSPLPRAYLLLIRIGCRPQHRQIPGCSKIVNFSAAVNTPISRPLASVQKLASRSLAALTCSSALLLTVTLRTLGAQLNISSNPQLTWQ